MNNPDDWDDPTDSSVPQPIVRECVHQVTEVRLRTLSNKSTAIYKQCCTCGAPVSLALKKSLFSPEEQKLFKPYDEDLSVLYNEQRSIALRDQWAKERTEIKKINQAEYAEYRRSPAWRLKREAVFERDNYLCQGCRQARATEVHHLTYSHIYQELLFQLISVCEPCHTKIHAKEKGL